MQHKVKPVEFAVAEIEKKKKFSLLEKERLSHNKYRYIVIPIDFNLNTFQIKNRIEVNHEILIIEYSGTNHPRVIPTQIVAVEQITLK